jgi:hypothetical protein
VEVLRIPERRGTAPKQGCEVLANTSSSAIKAPVMGRQDTRHSASFRLVSSVDRANERKGPHFPSHDGETLVRQRMLRSLRPTEAALGQHGQATSKVCASAVCYISRFAGGTLRTGLMREQSLVRGEESKPSTE